MNRPPVRRVRWRAAFRILPTRYPPIQVFERLCDPADREALAELESLTNDRIREELGDLSLVPVRDRVSGTGAGWVMGSFLHIGRPSRFSDGTYGVYYCACLLDTVVAETTFHMGRFYAATSEPPIDADMRVLVGKVDTSFHDVRGPERRWRAIHDRDDYGAAQQFGRALREAGSNGIAYDSVRHDGGQCLGAFRPRAVQPPHHDRYLVYHWNGERVDRWFDHRTERWNSTPS